MKISFSTAVFLAMIALASLAFADAKAVKPEDKPGYDKRMGTLA